jgi:hypothetical protein
LIPPAAHAADLNAVADAYTRADRATSNYGTGSRIRLNSWNGTTGFLKFDLDSVSKVDSATLTLRVVEVKSSGTVHVYRALGDWGETSVNHSNMPSRSSRLMSFNVGPSDIGRTIEVDLTALAGDLVADKSRNFGILLDTSNANVHLGTRESGSPIKLIVDGGSGGDDGGDGGDGDGGGAGGGGSGSGGSSAITLASVADAFTRRDKPTSNFGGNSVLRTQLWSEVTSFARFEMGDVSSVDSSTLRVSVDDVKRAGQISVHRVLDPWTERSITHDNRPRLSAPLASFSVGAADIGKTIQLDATQLARELITNQSRNHGIAFTTTNAKLHIDSRESGSPIQFVLNGSTGGGADGGGGDGDDGGDGGDGGGGGNSPPSILGDPQTAVTAGSTYDFRPTSSDPDGDNLTHSVDNKPSWASFRASTGRLYGTPSLGDVGTYPGVSITVSDGQNTATLGPFDIAVAEGSDGRIALSWDIPTRNTDGSALTDLDNFRIAWDMVGSSASGYIMVTNPSVSSYVVENLAAGTYDFEVIAINSQGVASAPSNSVRAEVN